jgi:ABC-type Fe3+-siderophore transport system permease subunit
MKPLTLIMSFLPIIAFSLLSKVLPHGDIGWAALIAVIFAVINIVTHRPYLPPKILNVTQVAMFVIVTVVSFVGDASTDRWVAIWIPPAVALVVGVVILAMIPVVPFTEQFARQSTPQAYWSSPTFKQINRVLSLGWGVALVGVGISRLIAVIIEQNSTGSHRAIDLVFAAAIPVVILIYMLRFSKSYPEKITHHDEGPTHTSPSAPATS